MVRRAKSRLPKSDLAKELWVNPRSNVRGQERNRAWEDEGNLSPSSGTRFLELADIALGLKKPTAKKAKAAAAGADQAGE